MYQLYFNLLIFDLFLLASRRTGVDEVYVYAGARLNGVPAFCRRAEVVRSVPDLPSLSLYIYIYIYVCVCVYVCMYVYVCIYIYICIHMYTHIHIYITN